MRRKVEDNISTHLPNGLSVKGCYRFSMTGCFFDLYVVNKDGYILASKNLSRRGRDFEAQECLKLYIDNLTFAIRKLRIDTCSDESVVTKILPTAIEHAFPRKAA